MYDSLGGRILEEIAYIEFVVTVCVGFFYVVFALELVFCFFFNVI